MSSRLSAFRPAVLRSFLLPALVAASATLGCDVPDGALDETEQAATSPVAQSKAIYAGRYTLRARKGTCEHSCLKYKDVVISGKGHHTVEHRCIQRSTDPNDCAGFSAAGLYDSPDKNNGFNAIPDFPDDPSQPHKYIGCGPKAAQNVLAYFGVRMSILGMTKYISTFDLGDYIPFVSHGENIGTFPDNLASGLQRALNELADGTFKVTRQSGVIVTAEIKRSIDAGMPIIVMVEGGKHFVTITGYNLQKNTLLVNDYPHSNDTVQPARELSMFDETFFDFGTTLGIHGIKGYEDYTVITIERTGGAAPTSGLFKASNDPTVYSLNGTKACYVSWDQFVAAGQPGFKTMTPHDADNFRASYVRGAVCSNTEAGLPFDPGLYKASNDPTIYKLNSTKACALTWDQFVALKQPAFNTIAPDQMTKFKTAFVKSGTALCTNKEAGL